jgi:hypothetical protein
MHLFLFGTVRNSSEWRDIFESVPGDDTHRGYSKECRIVLLLFDPEQPEQQRFSNKHRHPRHASLRCSWHDTGILWPTEMKGERRKTLSVRHEPAGCHCWAQHIQSGRTSNSRELRRTNLNLGGCPFGHGANPSATSQAPISLLINSRQLLVQRESLSTLTFVGS